jgi:sister chromatid cohesion protein PDS5
LTAACCLVDVLRIFAPDAPYSEKELQVVFDCLIKQLHGLGQVGGGNGVDVLSKKEQKYAYILESLATVKSCIILTELSQQGHDGAEDQLK